MYSKITNPKTGRRVSVFSKKGKEVLKFYLNQSGGANPKKWSSYSCKGLSYDDCYDQRNSRCKFVGSKEEIEKADKDENYEPKGYCRKTNSSSKKRGKRNLKK